MGLWNRYKYKVNDIAKDLLVDAKAVVRTSELSSRFSDIDKAVMSVKYLNYFKYKWY